MIVACQVLAKYRLLQAANTFIEAVMVRVSEYRFPLTGGYLR